MSARRRLRTFATLGAAALIFGVTTMHEPRDPAHHSSSDRTAEAPAGAPAGPSAAPTPLVEVGPTPGDRDIAFDLVLEFPGREAMQAYALAVGDRASPEYRHFLSADEIGARFGLSDEALARVRAWAAEQGIAVVATSSQRITLSVEAPAGTVESVFDVRLHDYVDAAGQTFHAPDLEPRIPAALDGLVAAVEGLDARPSERPAFAPIAAGPLGGMTPAVIDRAYELEGLRALNLHGEGQTVAIVSLDTFDPDDVAQFDQLAGTSGPPVEKVAVDGGVRRPGDGQGEVNLDIDVIRAVAPKAQILDYEAPNKGGAIGAIIDRIVADGRADIASISWGSCELARPPASLARMAASMAAAAAAGVTVYVASGDHGAYGCIDQDREDLRISVDSPGGDPNVIGVGGTYMSMLEDGTYIDEVAWEEPLTGWAPGGGLSAYYTRPSWQTGVGVQNGRSNGMRQVPDVAAAADPVSGFLSVSEGEAGSAGGTSAAAPFWAGFTVLVRQLAQREGVDGLGALGPTLYEVAAAQPAGAVFHDVSRGGNLFDNASPGWDYATGLGTPRGTPLAQAIVASVKSP